MPELPEVDRIVNQLRGELLELPSHVRVDLSPGYNTQALFFYPKLLRGSTGAEIAWMSNGEAHVALGQLGYLDNITRVGKYILFDFDSACLILHLGMTGSLITEDALGKHKFGKYLSARLSFHCGGDTKGFYLSDKRKFARCYIARGVSNVTNLKKHIFKSIGPDIVTISKYEFVNRYSSVANRRPTTLLKKLFLDQGVVSGIGNIYACEALHRLSYDPRITIRNAIISSPVVQPGMWEEDTEQSVRQAVQEIYRQAYNCIIDGITHGGSSVRDYFDLYGNPGTNQDHLRVYGRKGSSCIRKTHIAGDAFTGTRVCGGTIARVTVDNRGSFFCPKCQNIGAPREPLIVPGPKTLKNVIDQVRKESKSNA